MHKKLLLFVIISFITLHDLQAQGAIFGVKGGLTVGIQRWQNQDRDPLFTYNGDLFVESLPADGKFSLFLQLGYHNRGSATRFLGGTNAGGQSIQARTIKYEFRNIALGAGAKQRFDFGAVAKAYYSIGMRLEYTLGTNLDDFLIFNTLFYPSNDFVRKINYGFIAGGGLELPLSEYVIGFIELNIHPDFSNQYYQPYLENIYDPRTRLFQSLPERAIKNVSLELVVGVGFLRKIEYIDDNLF